jgi:hypothetical protein
MKRNIPGGLSFAITLVEHQFHDQMSWTGLIVDIKYTELRGKKSLIVYGWLKKC